MRLIGYLENGVRHIGALDGDKVAPLGTAAAFYSDTAVALAAEPAGPSLNLADLEQAPAVPETARVFILGINYLSHAEESKRLGDLDLPKHPFVIGRFGSTLVADGTEIPVPLNEGLDWECELAAVIGEKIWAATEDNAQQHVLGYTGFNDVTARAKQLETPSMTLGKNPDKSAPIGPVIVTADELPDPTGLRVQTRVNGVTKQDGNTRDLLFSVGQIIEYITDTITLLPGDVIATGTPTGVGAGRKPPESLHPGDVVEVEVENIGILRNTIVDRSKSHK
ncbi:fumarylacetoacetate hydrolase family protein [Rhodococcus jostii]|uniref:fumarylacetoacetate hydrolase family protein n=1 Tax=Rhodococcus jostii TaxID=132919 RepID=UPI00364CE4CF